MAKGKKGKARGGEEMEAADEPPADAPAAAADPPPLNRKARRAAAAAAAAEEAAALLAAARLDASPPAAPPPPPLPPPPPADPLPPALRLSAELWREILLRLPDARSLRASACVCSELRAFAAEDALWAAARAALYGAAPPPHRALVLRGERTRAAWERASRRGGGALRLGAMESLALCGGVGVSTHRGRLLRLWAADGRRLGAYLHKHELTACAAAGAVGAAADEAGRLLVFGVRQELAPALLPPAGGRGGAHSLAFVGGGAALASASASGVALCAAPHGEWGGAQVERRAVETAAALGDGEARPVCLAARGDAGLFGATARAAALFDVEAGGGAVWRAEWAGEGAQFGGASHTAHYAEGWALLAAAMGRGVVALWDAREPGEAGPAAAVATGGGDARWVQLQEDGRHGCLLLAPTAADCVRVYDIRRLVSGGGGGGGGEAVATLTPPPPPSGAPHACFAAADGVLVVGGGLHAPTAWRYDLAAAEGLPTADDEADGGAGRTRPAKVKPPRKNVRQNSAGTGKKTRMSYGSRR
ncbi:hypothetical protein AB1Y20_010753 [Prymnesium parvum]|uniref:F-box domain-containing protein n=1 Tax=Prymnesium parvum TaxID=97485 RepID=A0AB34IS85_PRYPA